MAVLLSLSTRDASMSARVSRGHTERWKRLVLFKLAKLMPFIDCTGWDDPNGVHIHLQIAKRISENGKAWRKLRTAQLINFPLPCRF